MIFMLEFDFPKQPRFRLFIILTVFLMTKPTSIRRIISATPLLFLLFLLPGLIMAEEVKKDPLPGSNCEASYDCDELSADSYEINCTDVTLTTDNFESGFGNWNDGGSDCALITNGTYANSGLVSARLRDNTSSSVLTSNELDLSTYSQITVEFSYVPVSMDNSNEDFWLQVSLDGGSSFTTVEEWNRGDEFENNIRYAESVSILGPFTTNTLLRFRCDASGNPDWVYLDDITVSACSGGGTPSCTDGILNGQETGIDCGGPDCAACPTCTDGILNGNETGIDCGGPDCAACPTCTDGIQNGSETDVDCGGPDCAACPTCTDGIQNGDETGVDCGGPDCGDCDSCQDGIQNGDETGVDCGGIACPVCPTCTDGVQNGDETDIDCGGPDCAACPTCSDGVQNGDETGVDCGGPDCAACPTCTDGVQNGDETGVDCGGPDCAACPVAYCASGANSFYEFIEGVTINGTSNTSGSDGGYADFTNTTVFSLSGTASISLNPGFPGGAYNENWTVYVDYNADSDFADAGEMVFQGSGSGIVTGSFIVPGGLTGTSRMRVMMRYGAYNSNSCGSYSWGEVEDYTVDFGTGVVVRGINSNSSLLPMAIDPVMELFPNPVRTDLTIRILLEEEKNREQPSWFIVDGTGKIVREGQASVEALRSGLNLYLNDLSVGMYYFSLNSSKGRMTKRFVVQP